MRQQVLKSFLFQVQSYQSGRGSFEAHIFNVLDLKDFDEKELEDLIQFFNIKLDNTLPIGVASYWTTLRQGVVDWKQKHYGE